MALIERMARENAGWACHRTRGELLKLGHRVAASTVRRVLKRLRIPPHPLDHLGDSRHGGGISSIGNSWSAAPEQPLHYFGTGLGVLVTQTQALIGGPRADPEMCHRRRTERFDPELLGWVVVGAVVTRFEQVTARSVVEDRAVTAVA